MFKRFSLGWWATLAQFLSVSSLPSSKPRCASAALALVSVLAFASIASAAEGGRIEGSVIDPSGAKVAGARVALRNEAGIVAYETRADSEGQFKIADVAAGRYTIAIEAAGFAQSSEEKLEVRAGATETIAVRLDVAAISDQIVITA